MLEGPGDILIWFWNECLKNPQWWQSSSAVVQGVATVVLVWLTGKYVQLTSDLAAVQIHPELHWGDDDELVATSTITSIRNVGRIDAVKLELRAQTYVYKEGAPFPIGSKLEQRVPVLKPDETLPFDFGPAFRNIPESLIPKQGLVLICTVIYHRESDLKLYKKEIWRQVLPESDGVLVVNSDLVRALPGGSRH